MRKLLMLISLLMLPDLVGAAELGFAAQRMDRVASEFADQARFHGNRHLGTDAAKLADASRRFSRSTKYDRSSHQLSNDYERLEQRFVRLAKTLDRNHANHRLAADFRRVERAMTNLRYAMPNQRHVRNNRNRHNDDDDSGDDYDRRDPRYRNDRTPADFEQIVSILRDLEYIFY